MVQEFYTTKEAALLLKVTASRIRQFVLENRLAAYKIGRDLLIKKKDLEDFQLQLRVRTGRPKKYHKN